MAIRGALAGIVAAVAGVIAFTAVVACSQPSAGGVPETPAAETVTLRVMSFNLLYGAGLERRFDEHIPRRFREHDRTSELMGFLREADADLIALQEAAGWDAGEPSFAARVAGELGMSHVLAPDLWELHVVLLSRYPIVAAEYVSRLQGFNGVALVATVAVEPGVEVQVIVVHLNSMSSATRTCQVDAVLEMAAARPARTLLVGDMNFRPEASQAGVLRAAGWQLLRAQERWPIDQVWVDAEGVLETGDWWESLDGPEGISDHWPVGVDVTMSLPVQHGEHRQPVAEPQPLQYECALPQR